MEKVENTFRINCRCRNCTGERTKRGEQNANTNTPRGKHHHRYIRPNGGGGASRKNANLLPPRTLCRSARSLLSRHRPKKLESRLVSTRIKWPIARGYGSTWIRSKRGRRGRESFAKGDNATRQDKHRWNRGSLESN